MSIFYYKVSANSVRKLMPLSRKNANKQCEKKKYIKRNSTSTQCNKVKPQEVNGWKTYKV